MFVYYFVLFKVHFYRYTLMDCLVVIKEIEKVKKKEEEWTNNK